MAAVLDLGTAKTCCLIARHDAQGRLRVLGQSIQATQGMRNAAIVDIDAVGYCAGAAVQAAETAARLKVESVYASLSAGQVQSERTRVSLPHGDSPIGPADIGDVLRLAHGRGPQHGRELLHFVPHGYAVDGARGIRDPRGLFGARLELETLLVTAPDGVLRTLRTAIGRAHLDVDGIVASGYAAGLAVLHPEERDLGVTVLDLGAGSTNIAVFSDGEPVFCDSVPVGGAHVTSDIARGLSTPLAYAERLKTLHGSCLPSADDERDLIDLQPIGGAETGDSLQAPRALLVRIIRARMEEIFEMVRQSMAAIESSRLAGGAVVLTGGGAQLHGIAELAMQVLDKRARIGRPGGVVGLGDMADSPAYATAVGMLLYAQKKLDGGFDETAAMLGQRRGVVERLRALLKIGR
jgi:cell division protein FtsA